MGALNCSFTASVAHVLPPKADVGDHSCADCIPSFCCASKCGELSNEVSVRVVALAKAMLGEELTAAVSDKTKESNQNWDNEQNGHGIVQEGGH